MEHTPHRLPESMKPEEIGPYLRRAREKFALSLEDVSAQLHIRPRYLTALEQGRMDELPGKVYARGYLATYAQFLGLAPEQVVALQFAPPAAPPVAPEAKEEVKVTVAVPVKANPRPVEYVPKPLPQTLDTLTEERPRWQAALIALALVAIAVMGYLRAGSGDEQAATATSVSEVPETLLASTRSMVMPTSQNLDCLSGELLLSCPFAQQDWHAFEVLLVPDAPPYIDMVAVNEALAAAYDEEAQQ